MKDLNNERKKKERKKELKKGRKTVIRKYLQTKTKERTNELKKEIMKNKNGYSVALLCGPSLECLCVSRSMTCGVFVASVFGAVTDGRTNL